jgi:hypothetical protein
MNRLAFILAALALPVVAQAQGGFIANDEPICYSWEGGARSAGSFSKCGPRWTAPPPAPVVVAAAPMVAPLPPLPPQVSCAPPPKPLIKPKRKPRPRPVC